MHSSPKIITATYDRLKLYYLVVYRFCVYTSSINEFVKIAYLRLTRSIVCIAYDNFDMVIKVLDWDLSDLIKQN